MLCTSFLKRSLVVKGGLLRGTQLPENSCPTLYEKRVGFRVMYSFDSLKQHLKAFERKRSLCAFLPGFYYCGNSLLVMRGKEF